MRGSAESALIRASSTGDQRGDTSAPKIGPSIIFHVNEMPGRKGKAIEVFNERSGRGSDKFPV
jgi:hypothetical protein